MIRNLSIISFVIFLGILSIYVRSSPTGVLRYSSASKSIDYFKGNFSDCQNLAMEEKKIIFMDAYTSWCGWCKKLDNITFSDSSVINYLNENFISIKVNMEKGEGPDLGTKYSVESYPTLLFIDSEGKALVKLSGYRSASEFLEELKYINQHFK